MTFQEKKQKAIELAKELVNKGMISIRKIADDLDDISVNLIGLTKGEREEIQNELKKIFKGTHIEDIIKSYKELYNKIF